nr:MULTISPECIES: M23 family metallopeptidase [Bacteroidales]
MNKEKQQIHKGLDIRCKGDAVLATENGGKVVSVNNNMNSAGGKTVTVEYSRPDGNKVQCTYMHLSDITVKAGDSVNAGQRLGTSGNTGSRTTGEHLHFGVTNIYSDGTKREVDPAAYLAEIAQKGNIKQQVMYNGSDLLAKYRDNENINTDKTMASDAWMKKLLSSEDSGVGISGCNDPIVEMAMTAFTSLMLLAAQIDAKSEEEQNAAISTAMDRRRIDLTSLMPGMKTCELSIEENGKAILKADNGELKISRELTSAELSRLSAVLNSNELSEESKRMRVTGLLNTVILSEAASRNFEQGMSQQQTQAETMKR